MVSTIKETNQNKKMPKNANDKCNCNKLIQDKSKNNSSDQDSAQKTMTIILMAPISQANSKNTIVNFLDTAFKTPILHLPLLPIQQVATSNQTQITK